MSIRSALKGLDEGTIKGIEIAAKKYRKDGYSGKEAARQAVMARIADLQEVVDSIDGMRNKKKETEDRIGELNELVETIKSGTKVRAADEDD